MLYPQVLGCFPRIDRPLQYLVFYYKVVHVGLEYTQINYIATIVTWFLSYVRQYGDLFDFLHEQYHKVRYVHLLIRFLYVFLHLLYNHARREHSGLHRLYHCLYGDLRRLVRPQGSEFVSELGHYRRIAFRLSGQLYGHLIHGRDLTRAIDRYHGHFKGRIRRRHTHGSEARARARQLRTTHYFLRKLLTKASRVKRFNFRLIGHYTRLTTRQLLRVTS